MLHVILGSAAMSIIGGGLFYGMGLVGEQATIQHWENLQNKAHINCEIYDTSNPDKIITSVDKKYHIHETVVVTKKDDSESRQVTTHKDLLNTIYVYPRTLCLRSAQYNIKMTNHLFEKLINKKQIDKVQKEHNDPHYYLKSNYNYIHRDIYEFRQFDGPYHLFLNYQSDLIGVDEGFSQIRDNAIAEIMTRSQYNSAELSYNVAKDGSWSKISGITGSILGFTFGLAIMSQSIK